MAFKDKLFTLMSKRFYDKQETKTVIAEVQEDNFEVLLDDAIETEVMVIKIWFEYFDGSGRNQYDDLQIELYPVDDEGNVANDPLQDVSIGRIDYNWYMFSPIDVGEYVVRVKSNSRQVEYLQSDWISEWRINVNYYNTEFKLIATAYVTWQQEI